LFRSSLKVPGSRLHITDRLRPGLLIGETERCPCASGQKSGLALVIVSSLAIFISLTVGCGESGPPMAPVDGVVTYKGKPVQYANVMFLPQNVPGGQTGFAQTDAEGKFSKVLTGGKTHGAVVGSHFVTVTEGWPPDQEIPTDQMGMQKSPPRGPWANKYRDSSNPALKVEVVAGQDNHFDFDVSE
jgi:hypothetical protein